MFWLLTLLACGDGKLDADGSSDGTGRGFSWSGGDFWFYTNEVDDGCFEGALRVLFMPEGSEEPHRFEYLIYLPGYDELPYEQTVDLRAPFIEMPVTIDEGPDDQLQIRGSVMEAVELGTRYGDCVATMTVDAELLPTDADTAEGGAELTISDVRGDDRCPVMPSDTCSVVLGLEARRG